MAKKSYTSTQHTRKGHLTPFGSRTDVGCLRDHNEDSLAVSPPLYVVADGMGGHAAGEVASEIAVNTIVAAAPAHADAQGLADAVVEANREVIEASHDERGREGMGCTVTAALLEGERLVIAQVGDSRAYLMHKGELQQVTRDHSLMAELIEAGDITPEEARVHPKRSVITRALGSDPLMQPDIYELNVEAGDRLLLCSDGLSTMLTDDRIANTLGRIGDAQRCASQLVNEAIEAGGYDNITVIVVDIDGFKEKHRKKAAVKTKLSVLLCILLLVAVAAGAVFAGKAYVENSAYLGIHQGKVAIFRGVPGEVLGQSFSQLERQTDVSAGDLQPGTINRLNSGIPVDNLAAAEALVETYKQEAQTRTGKTAESDEDADGKSANGEQTEGPGGESAAQ
ncbi:Stp1/IreP family PP2C-type Ser/Thr phosphatase [Adlercreutzia aquisgranensis]|uniref:Stp1/IreP family PP2C-type Ser/Thr phosphatase n=1 Tax=Adlercreutzia aquisgranensis TaxID=2941323 RepID=UPI00203F219C|nr:Stp1/IreP family PP2C-type Ser/Thr phosphatase [Adlercreutzia aquisgranensis]